MSPVAAEKDIRFKCDVCGRSYSHPATLKLHTYVHSPNLDELKLKCSYEGCGYSTRLKSEMKRHVNGFHLHLMPHQCRSPGCTKSFAKTSNRLTHERRMHSLDLAHKRKVSVVDPSTTSSTNVGEVRTESSEADNSNPTTPSVESSTPASSCIATPMTPSFPDVKSPGGIRLPGVRELLGAPPPTPYSASFVVVSPVAMCFPHNSPTDRTVPHYHFARVISGPNPFSSAPGSYAYNRHPGAPPTSPGAPNGTAPGDNASYPFAFPVPYHRPS